MITPRSFFSDARIDSIRQSPHARLNSLEISSIESLVNCAVAVEDGVRLLEVTLVSIKLRSASGGIDLNLLAAKVSNKFSRDRHDSRCREYHDYVSM